eukprot:gene36348-44842_t
MHLSEIAFAEFIRSLTQYDPNSASLLEDKDISAGGAKKVVHVDDTMGSQRKRSTQVAQTSLFGDHNKHSEKPKTMRKMHNEITANDPKTFTSNKVKDILFSDVDNVSILSHAQQDMINGAFSDNRDDNLELQFNSEQKLQREQVLAALRKLHAAELSMDDFQDKLFAMGFDLPETVAAELSRSVASGNLDQRKVVKLLDATVFKVAALEDCKNRSVAAALQLKFIQSVRNSGISSVLELGQLFRRFDLDGDGLLSFSEFRKGIRDFQSSLGQRVSDDTDLKTLFHNFDKNGDGVLDSSEFLDTIRGELNAKRTNIVRQAFLSVNRYAAQKVLLDDVAQHFNPAAHPEVVEGEKSERDVMNDFVLWFSNAPGFDGFISGEDFEEYFASISPFITNDGVFESMMREMWSLSETFAVPPAEYHQRHGPPVPPPQAKQSHGDLVTWGQGKTRLEVVSGYENKNLHTNVKFGNAPVLGVKTVMHGADEGYKQKGTIEKLAGMKNVSDKSVFKWNTAQQSKYLSAEPVAVPSFQVKLDRAPSGVSNSEPHLSYQLDDPQAGMSTYNKRTLNEHAAYNWSEIRLKQHGVEPPFGRTLPNNTSANGNMAS